MPYSYCSRALAFCVILGFALVSHASSHKYSSAFPKADTRPLVSGERVRVKKITRDISGAIEQLDKGGVSPFQDPSYVEKFRSAANRYRQALKKYPQMSDSDVQAAHQQLAQMENMLRFGEGEAKKQTQGLGDVQQRLKTIEAGLHRHRAPVGLIAPFSNEKASKWVAVAVKAKKTALDAIAQIQSIAQVAHLPLNPGTVQSGAPYDRNDLNRLLHLANRTKSKVDESMAATQNNLKHQISMQKQELDYYRKLNPNNPSHRANAFLKEGAQERVYAELARHLAVAESVGAYMMAFGKQPSSDAMQRVNEIKQLRNSYEKNRRKALGDSRLPVSKSKDGSLIGIANEILAKPRYTFGEHGPIVITTANVVDKEKESSEIEFDEIDISLSGDITLSGTETTWTYRWKEFRFATPIKDASTGTWRVWWITAKKFASGAGNTPMKIL